jgi:hypothetical protein
MHGERGSAVDAELLTDILQVQLDCSFCDDRG